MNIQVSYRGQEAGKGERASTHQPANTRVFFQDLIERAQRCEEDNGVHVVKEGYPRGCHPEPEPSSTSTMTAKQGHQQDKGRFSDLARSRTSFVNLYSSFVQSKHTWRGTHTGSMSADVEHAPLGAENAVFSETGAFVSRD